MKFEYAVLLVIACGAVPAMGGVGHAFDAAVASGADGRSHRATVAHVASMATSQQAGASSAARAAWELLPKAVQADAADVVAFKRYVTGEYNNMSVAARPDIPAALAAGSHPELASLFGYKYGPQFPGAMEAVSKVAAKGGDLADEFAHGKGLREMVLDSALRDERGVASAAGELPEGSMRRGARLVMPDVSESLWDHFFSWAKTLPTPAMTGKPLQRTRLHGAERLLSRDFGGYMTHTRGSAGDVGKAMGSPDFGIALKDMPKTLKLWSETPYTEPSAAIRRSMDGNVRIMRDGLEASKARVAEHAALWDGASGNTAWDLRERRAVLTRAEQAVAAFEAKGEVSREEALSVVYTYLAADARAHRDHVKMKPFKGFTDGEDSTYVPLLAATDEHWSYDQVPSWRPTGFYPLEVPVGLKEYDGAIGTPLVYARHDHGHILDIVLKRRSMNIEEGALAAVEAHQEVLRRTNPKLSAQIDRVMGEAYWEPYHPLQAAEIIGTRLAEASEVMAGWLHEWANKTGNAGLARRTDGFRVMP